MPKYIPGGELRIKSIDTDALRASGYLVLFTDEDDTDLEGEYFTKSTDLGPVSDGMEVVLPAYFHHGLDETLGRQRIGYAKAKADDVGIWADYWIAQRKEYIAELMEAGILGQSSGPVQHLVGLEPGQKATFIKSWPLGEASLTPTPAEHRTYAKSVLDELKALRIERQMANSLRQARASVFAQPLPQWK